MDNAGVGQSPQVRLGPLRARRQFRVFADESATGPGYPCYGIGALVLPASRLDAFNEYFLQKVCEHGVVGEVHWSKVGSSHGLMNFAIELWRDVVNHHEVRFAAIVVHKALFRNWQEDPEKAFYQTYSFLLRHAARVQPGEFEVAIDDRSDSYPKQDEVVEIVSNHMLRQLNADSSISRVTKNDSKLLPGLQVADLFTGAITHSHAARMGTLKKGLLPNPAKLLLVERMAEVVGWPDLYCDTMPHSALNIWHFPKEWRAVPETRLVNPTRQVSFVTPAELLRGAGR